ncbi:hypothetical protein [Streptomyces cinnamoneus]|uniref:hypothetical protein n=1 Tax=Streptomyces cinnamoneus TaxID=53446 RepID=UPI0011AFE803|nr:hypothetical protein [Streptomyces cinnamoneus]
MPTFGYVLGGFEDAVRRRPGRLDGHGLDIALILHMTALADLLDEAVSAASTRSGTATEPVAGTQPVAVAGRKTVRVNSDCSTTSPSTGAPLGSTP